MKIEEIKKILDEVFIDEKNLKITVVEKPVKDKYIDITLVNLFGSKVEGIILLGVDRDTFKGRALDWNISEIVLSFYKKGMIIIPSYGK